MNAEKIAHLPKAENRINYDKLRQELIADHADLPEYQLRRWEQFMVDKDDLAVGAITTMMQVRNYRKQSFESSQAV